MTSSDAGTELTQASEAPERGFWKLRCRLDVGDQLDGVVEAFLNGGGDAGLDIAVEGSGRLKKRDGVSTALGRRL
jgi:hypothetical protein